MISAIGARAKRPRARGTAVSMEKRQEPWVCGSRRRGREVYGWARTYEIVAARSPKHQLPSLK